MLPESMAVSMQISEALEQLNVPYRDGELLEAHQRVRRASKIRNVPYRVEPQLPPDVLGIYVYLPKI